MAIIAIVHLLWLSLLFWGIVCLICAIRFGRVFVVSGIGLILVSLPAVAFCCLFWPFDFFGQGRAIRESITIQGYTIDFVQKPGIDFYETFFEIVRSDGEITRIMIDADDNKIWFPTTVNRGGRIYFVGALEGVGAQTSYVDPVAGVIFGGYFREAYRFAALDFDRPWARHSGNGS